MQRIGQSLNLVLAPWMQRGMKAAGASLPESDTTTKSGQERDGLKTMPNYENKKYEKDPNQLGFIKVQRGKGDYATSSFFGGYAFNIPDGTYVLKNFEYKDKRNNEMVHGISVKRVHDEPMPNFAAIIDPPRVPAVVEDDAAPF